MTGKGSCPESGTQEPALSPASHSSPSAMSSKTCTCGGVSLSVSQQSLRDWACFCMSLLSTIATFAFNGLAGSGKLTGIGIGDVSADRANAIVPDGWAFSIWGGIYFLVALLVVAQVCVCVCVCVGV